MTQNNQNREGHEILVSIRMPSSLVKELKQTSQQEHYLDLSEHIRTIVRDKCLQYLDPYASEMQKFREDLKKDLLTKSASKTTLIKDLKRIAEELSHEL